MTYTMKELAAKVGKTEQYIRKILKKERFSNLTEHIIRNDNTGRVVYDDVILEKLLEYFETKPTEQKKETVESGVGVGSEEIEENKSPDNNPPPSDSEAAEDSNIKRVIDLLESQLEYEKKRVADLEKEVGSKEAERLYWVNQFEAIRKKNDELNEQLKLMAPAPQEEEKKTEEPAPIKMSFREWWRQRFKK